MSLFGKITGVAVLLMFANVFALGHFVKKPQLIKVNRAIEGLHIVLCMYCIGAGIYMLVDWQDPFAQVAPEKLVSPAVQHGGKGGFFVLIIKYWPVFLIGISSYFLYPFVSFWRRAPKSKLS